MRAIIVWSWEKGKYKKSNKLSKITRVDKQEPPALSAGIARAILVIYILKYWYHAIDNPSEETISENSQIKDMKQ